MLIGRLDETIHGVTDWRSFRSFFVVRGFALSSPIIICFPDWARGHLGASVFRPKVLLKQRHPAGVWKWRITRKENKRFVCWSFIFSFNWKATLSGKTTIKRPVSYHLKKNIGASRKEKSKHVQGLRRVKHRTASCPKPRCRMRRFQQNPNFITGTDTFSRIFFRFSFYSPEGVGAQ